MNRTSIEERARIACPVCGVRWEEHGPGPICDRYRPATAPGPPEPPHDVERSGYVRVIGPPPAAEGEHE